jgi:hypothetical protein
MIQINLRIMIQINLRIMMIRLKVLLQLFGFMDMLLAGEMVLQDWIV